MEPRENNLSSSVRNDEREAARSEGIRWLELIGEGHIVGTPIPYEKDGRPLNAEDFPLLCGDHVRPVFTAIERLEPSDPKRQTYIDSVKRTLHTFLNEFVEK